jgi:hypothetical protein
VREQFAPHPAKFIRLCMWSFLAGILPMYEYACPCHEIDGEAMPGLSR